MARTNNYAALESRIDRLEKATAQLQDVSLKLMALLEQEKAPAKQVKSSAKAPAKKPVKAEAPAVVNYGTWNGYCEARRKAAGFGDKWVDKDTFYAKLDKLGWEKTHSYRGKFYHHGSPIESKKQ